MPAQWQRNTVRGERITATDLQLKKYFKECDTNKDGFLDKNELEEAFKRLGAHFPKWRAGRALSIADQDGDGFISEEELDALVDYAKQKGYKIIVKED